MDLTKRQKEIFDFIGRYGGKYGYPPTRGHVESEDAKFALGY